MYFLCGLLLGLLINQNKETAPIKWPNNFGLKLFCCFMIGPTILMLLLILLQIFS